MNIEIGSKWVKDGEVVEVHNITETVGRDEVICYKCKQGKIHILFDCDFLEQHKPYEVVYEYQYAYMGIDGMAEATTGFYKDDTEFVVVYKGSFNDLFQRLDFTKRERK